MRQQALTELVESGALSRDIVEARNSLCTSVISNLRRKYLFWLNLMRGCSPSWWRRNGGRQQAVHSSMLRAACSHLLGPGSRKGTRTWTRNLKASDGLPPARPHFLLSPPSPSWAPDVQTHEPMGIHHSSLHSPHHQDTWDGAWGGDGVMPHYADSPRS